MLLKAPLSYLCWGGNRLGCADGVGAIYALWAWAVSRVQPLSRMCFNGEVACPFLCVKDANPSVLGRLSMFHLQSTLPAGHVLIEGTGERRAGQKRERPREGEMGPGEGENRGQMLDRRGREQERTCVCSEGLWGGDTGKVEVLAEHLQVFIPVMAKVLLKRYSGLSLSLDCPVDW